LPTVQVTPEQSNPENRRHRRVSSRLRCWCEGENVTVYARIGNLSEGGLFLRTSTPMPKGSRALVRFRDGDGADAEEVSAEATVVWTREAVGDQPAGMGLMFGPMPQEKLDAIRRLVGKGLKPLGA
jgi:uncharacterized protein (TIGR02266 family)